MKTVNELCRLTGVTRKTLFYYDRIGLLTPAVRIGKQNSKYYEDDAAEKLMLIHTYKQAGLQLSEIRRLLYDENASREEILHQALRRLTNQRERLSAQIARAEELLRQTQE